MLRKGLLFIAVLGLVGTAGASEISLFWSTSGISNPDLTYDTGLTDFQPSFVDPTPIQQELPGTYDLFLWGQFPGDWQGYRIFGLDLKFMGNATHDMSAAYRQRWGDQPNQKRWDGTFGDPLDRALVAVAAEGIVFDPVVPNLILADGTFLLGAAHVTGTDNQTLTMALDTAADGLGIIVHDPNGNVIVPDPTVTPATMTFIPEPSSALLVLAVAFCRRR